MASVVPCLVADSLNIAFVTSATDNSTTEPTFAVNKANSLMKISVAGFFLLEKNFCLVFFLEIKSSVVILL